jgi:hypothetical protein
MSEAHEHGQGEEGFGVALGFRIFDVDGDLYMAEAEISAYVDDPAALGASLLFHTLSDLDPTAVPDDDEDEDDGGWRVDVDEELTRDEKAPMSEQFQAILRQLAGLSDADLAAYLHQAREETGMAED